MSRGRKPTVLSTLVKTYKASTNPEKDKFLIEVTEKLKVLVQDVNVQ